MVLPIGIASKASSCGAQNVHAWFSEDSLCAVSALHMLPPSKSHCCLFLQLKTNTRSFFEQVGLDSEQSYSLGVGANGLALFACLCNWFILMPYLGRRTVYVWGLVFLQTFCP